MRMTGRPESDEKWNDTGRIRSDKMIKHTSRVAEAELEG